MVSPKVASPQGLAFVVLINQFQDETRQIELIRSLQSATSADRKADLEAFALMWRDGSTGSPIDLVSVFRSYKNQPHQNAALAWFQRTSKPKTWEAFVEGWRKHEAVRGSSFAKRLNVPYYQQVDNVYEPMRTCNTSSCAMVAKFMGANISGDDEYYKIVRKYGDTTDHGAQTHALQSIGIKSGWHQNLDFDDLFGSINAGLPVVIGILHRGDLHSPTGGHMVVVIGFDKSGGLICHDPFGSLFDSGGPYTGAVTNGKAVVYPRHVLNRRWTAEGANSGWGRIFSKQ